MRDVQFFYNKTQNTGAAFTGYEPSRDLIVFSFKGTDDVKGSILDADFIKINLPNCKDCAVHRGFLYYYENLLVFLLQSYKIFRVKYPQSKILVTGHSLGSAATYFLVIDLW